MGSSTRESRHVEKRATMGLAKRLGSLTAIAALLGSTLIATAPPAGASARGCTGCAASPG